MDPGKHIAWFVVITRWGQWKKLTLRLSELHVQHFIPATYNTLVFLRTEKARALNLVNAGEVKGRFLIDQQTHTLLEVPNKQMEDFIRVVTEQPEAECSPQVPLRKGMRVKMVRGPLKGIEGEIEETPNGVHLIVAIQSLICARITVSREDVAPLETGG